LALVILLLEYIRIDTFTLLILLFINKQK